MLAHSQEQYVALVVLDGNRHITPLVVDLLRDRTAVFGV